MRFIPARLHLVPIRYTWYLHSDGDNMQSNYQCGELPSFPITMAQKSRSSVTKIRSLAELHIVFSLGGVRVQPCGRIRNLVLPSCVQLIKLPEQIFFSLSSIGSVTVLPIISPLFFFHWTCASLENLVMFIPDVNFVFIFIASLKINTKFTSGYP